MGPELLDIASPGRLAVRRRGLLPSSESTDDLASYFVGSGPDLLKSFADRTVQAINGVGAELETLLDDLVYLGPLRSAPQRFYQRGGRGHLPGDGHDVAMYLFDNATVVAQVNEWLQRLEIPYSLDVVPVSAGPAGLLGNLVALTLTDRRSGVTVTPADVGFGISQVLPIVVEMLAGRNRIVCVEQPETHIHPRLQARLADLLIESADRTGRGNQLIVETHSEHLLLRLQRRIREGAVDANAVSVLYVDQVEGEPATVQRLRMDEDGDFIDEWPSGFFDDRLDDLLGGL